MLFKDNSIWVLLKNFGFPLKFFGKKKKKAVKHGILWLKGCTAGIKPLRCFMFGKHQRFSIM